MQPALCSLPRQYWDFSLKLISRALSWEEGWVRSHEDRDLQDCSEGRASAFHPQSSSPRLSLPIFVDSDSIWSPSIFPQPFLISCSCLPLCCHPPPNGSGPRALCLSLPFLSFPNWPCPLFGSHLLPKAIPQSPSFSGSCSPLTKLVDWAHLPWMHAQGIPRTDCYPRIDVLKMEATHLPPRVTLLSDFSISSHDILILTIIQDGNSLVVLYSPLSFTYDLQESPNLVILS